MAWWRSDDPGSDKATVRLVQSIVEELAARYALPDEVVEGDGDAPGLMELAASVFFAGRACGARAVLYAFSGDPLPNEVPKKGYAVQVTKAKKKPKGRVGAFGTFLPAHHGVQPAIFPGVRAKKP
jgi:hypothetical protein